MTGRIRVLLADDQVLVRTGFGLILTSEPDIDVVGEAENGSAAVAQVQRLAPDVVVMDIKAYAEPKTVQIPNILGDLEPFNAIGTVTFPLNGAEHTMEAWKSGQRLWFVFRDQTSGRDTYPSARFLYTDAPVDGKVVMDFNYTQNPPCAYNPYTTCPLPPQQNRLSVPIAAGEKKYHTGS